jgi:hypothetical protein
VLELRSGTGPRAVSALLPGQKVTCNERARGDQLATDRRLDTAVGKAEILGAVRGCGRTSKAARLTSHCAPTPLTSAGANEPSALLQVRILTADVGFPDDNRRAAYAVSIRAIYFFSTLEINQLFVLQRIHILSRFFATSLLFSIGCGFHIALPPYLEHTPDGQPVSVYLGTAWAWVDAHGLGMGRRTRAAPRFNYRPAQRRQ